MASNDRYSGYPNESDDESDTMDEIEVESTSDTQYKSVLVSNSGKIIWPDELIIKSSIELFSFDSQEYKDILNNQYKFSFFNLITMPYSLPALMSFSNKCKIKPRYSKRCRFHTLQDLRPLMIYSGTIHDVIWHVEINRCHCLYEVTAEFLAIVMNDPTEKPAAGNEIYFLLRDTFHHFPIFLVKYPFWLKFPDILPGHRVVCMGEMIDTNCMLALEVKKAM